MRNFCESGIEGVSRLGHLLGARDPQFNVVAAGLVEKLGNGIEVVTDRRRGRTGPFCHFAVGNGLGTTLAKQGGRSQHQRGSRNLSFQGFGLGQRLSHERLASLLITWRDSTRKCPTMKPLMRVIFWKYLECRQSFASLCKCTSKRQPGDPPRSPGCRRNCRFPTTGSRSASSWSCRGSCTWR